MFRSLWASSTPYFMLAHWWRPTAMAGWAGLITTGPSNNRQLQTPPFSGTLWSPVCRCLQLTPPPPPPSTWCRQESALNICISWNKGTCIFPSECTYLHVCATCQLAHKAQGHQGTRYIRNTRHTSPGSYVPGQIYHHNGYEEGHHHACSWGYYIYRCGHIYSADSCMLPHWVIYCFHYPCHYGGGAG